MKNDVIFVKNTKTFWLLMFKQLVNIKNNKIKITTYIFYNNFFFLPFEGLNLLKI